MDHQRLEPQTYRLRAGSANQLSEWSKKLVEVKGLEPPAPWSQTTCATKLRYTSIYLGGEGGIRTLAPVLPSLNP